ncbi:FxSxx-COOH system tetratricopeptide repeat protein [Paractinoplanes hotanensis]|uniref:FxSxx-COOH system tetratricopeptide repeat protein n=1 Tax=Paractinoplanes hotanensis TaxID=2906497 RepID=A0ABT0YAC9_9ACTN|nr:FxSxx-COOH system tetratricopeptide repeat protein [Actinoplanes hotanensis]MCM4082785.1 FxSxx-COOH system tetratricopeptide repeat protein [Actinoplanes hotanensis]
MTDGVAGRDFFISFAGVNRGWAEWIAVELERANYTTVVQTFDFRPGTNFVHRMQEAAATAHRTIAVLSPAYLTSEFGEAEWGAAFVRDPTGEKRLLLPVLVQACKPPGLLASRVWVDLVGVDEDVARRRLLAAADENRARQKTAAFPGARTDSGRFPGLGPAISNLASRSAAFSGRKDDLLRLYSALRAEPAPPAVAVHGLGGVGKSELVREYAHRYASDYGLIWWIDAEQVTSIWAGLAALARRLGIADGADQAETATRLFDELRGRSDWLLIYDNAQSLEDLRALLSTGAGDVLITSRSPTWSPRAVALPLDVWTRAESVDFLHHRTGADADRAGLLAQIADLVGDLPLALEEAATFLDETGSGLEHYRDLLREQARELFGLAPVSAEDEADANHQRVATVWAVSLDQVRQQEPAAEELLSLLAYLEPAVPRNLPVTAPGILPDQLATVAAKSLAYDRLIGALRRFSLIAAGPHELKLHRLVQAQIRARLTAEAETEWASTATALLRHAFPDGAPAAERGPFLAQLITATGHARRLKTAGLDSAWLLVRGAAYLCEQGLYRQARSLAEQAAESLAENRTNHFELADRHAELGRLLVDLDEMLSAGYQYRLALRAAEEAFGPDDPHVAARLDDVGNTARLLNDLTESAMHFERALRIEATARRHAALAGAVQSLGRYEDARAHWENAVEISAAADPEGLETGRMRNGLGNVLLEMGDTTTASREFERSLHIVEVLLGPEHPEVAELHNNLGSALQALGDYPAAREHAELALAISREALGPSAPDVGIRLNNLANVLRAQGDLKGAQTALENALRIGLTELGPNHPALALWHYNLGRVRGDMGEQAEAQRNFAVALRISETALGREHPQTRAIRAALNEQNGRESKEADDE